MPALYGSAQDFMRTVYLQIILEQWTGLSSYCKNAKIAKQSQQRIPVQYVDASPGKHLPWISAESLSFGAQQSYWVIYDGCVRLLNLPLHFLPVCLEWSSGACKEKEKKKNLGTQIVYALIHIRIHLEGPELILCSDGKLAARCWLWCWLSSLTAGEKKFFSNLTERSSKDSLAPAKHKELLSSSTFTQHGVGE